MLACQSSGCHILELNEHYFDCSERLKQISPGIRAPLFELQNFYSPQPPGHTVSAYFHRHMQHSAANTQNYDRFTSSQTQSERNVIEQDTGLGITTEENIFANSYPTSGVEQEHSNAYEGPETNLDQIAESEHRRKLSSPFNESYYTPASEWKNAYPQSTLNESMRSNFTTTPDQRFLMAPDGSVQRHYAMSPASYAESPHDLNAMHSNQFKRPPLRHNSASSYQPPSSMYSYKTPSTEASPFHWTPQSTTPVWQDTAQYFDGQSHVPTVTLDYSACSSVEQTPEMHPAQPVRAVMPMPSRKKPHLRPSLSESCVPRMSSPARLKAASSGYLVHDQAYGHQAESVQMPQLPLPPLPPSVLINTPRISDQGLMMQVTQPPPYPHPHRRSTTSIPKRPKQPTSPPPSDFAHKNMPFLVPMKQNPTFEGDLYTPRYKRRTSRGRWEGWCGYCQPGRWLDLKNSRYWEDKLRNHGICAKTKVKFAEPERIRWVDADGLIVSQTDLDVEGGDPFVDQRRREGYCGVCHTWVSMDGMRTKARDRAVGWWTHAYKCHDHEKAAKAQAAVAIAAAAAAAPG